MMRQLSDFEKLIVKRFAEKMSNPEQRKQLLADLENASVTQETNDRASIVFHIENYIRPVYHGQHLFAAEGTMYDQDGVELSVCLYADENDRMLELEFIRWGEGPLLGPLWDSLQVWG